MFKECQLLCVDSSSALPETFRSFQCVSKITFDGRNKSGLCTVEWKVPKKKRHIYDGLYIIFNYKILSVCYCKGTVTLETCVRKFHDATASCNMAAETFGTIA